MPRSNSDDFEVERVKLGQTTWKAGSSGKKVKGAEELFLFGLTATGKRELLKETASHQTTLTVRLLPGKKRLSIEICEVDYAAAMAGYRKAEEKREASSRGGGTSSGYGYGGGMMFGGGMFGGGSYSDEESDFSEEGFAGGGGRVKNYRTGWEAVMGNTKTRVVQFEYRNVNSAKRGTGESTVVKVKADTCGHCYKKPSRGGQLKVSFSYVLIKISAMSQCETRVRTHRDDYTQEMHFK